MKRLAASLTVAAQQQRLLDRRTRGTSPRRGRLLPRGDGGVRRDADPGHLVRPRLRGRPASRASARRAATTQARRRARSRKARRGASRTAEERSPEVEKRSTKNLPRRHAPATASRRSSKLTELVDGATGSPARRRSWSRCASCTRRTAWTRRGGDRRHEQFREYRSTPPARPPAAPRAVRGRRLGPQGRRRRQRRDPCVHRAAAGARRGRPAVPPDQGGDPLGARGTICAGAATRSPGSGWCRDSG